MKSLNKINYQEILNTLKSQTAKNITLEKNELRLLILTFVEIRKFRLSKKLTIKLSEDLAALFPEIAKISYFIKDFYLPENKKVGKVVIDNPDLSIKEKSKIIQPVPLVDNKPNIH